MTRIVPQFPIGHTYKNKQGLVAKIVEYKKAKDVTIEFEDGERVRTTTAYIRKGLPLHPTYGKILVGDKFFAKDGDIVEVIKYESYAKILCRWKSDGATKYVESKTIRDGILRHPNKHIKGSGDRFQNSKGEWYTILEYNSSIDIEIIFDGLEESQTTTNSNIKNGNIAPLDRFISRVGSIVESKSGWTGEVVEYLNAGNVRVRWEDGSEEWYRWASIESGHVKPSNLPSVFGVGYLGVGKYVSQNRALRDGQEYVPQDAYATWVNMLKRLYENVPKGCSKNKPYLDCTIEEEWKNFQNFGDWATKQVGWDKREINGDRWCLDKDILIPGNRVYGPEKCVYVPNEINAFFSIKDQGEHGFGINMINPKYENAKIGFISRCTNPITGEREYLGFFQCPREAESAYLKRKRECAIMLAYKWIGEVDNRVINALLNYNPWERHDVLEG